MHAYIYTCLNMNVNAMTLYLLNRLSNKAILQINFIDNLMQCLHYDGTWKKVKLLVKPQLI